MGQITSGAIGSVKKDGNIVSTVTAWTLNPPTADSTSVATSNSKGGVISTTGAKDTSGSFTSKGLVPVAIPGEKLVFSGFCGPSSGNVNGTEEGVIYSVPVIISSISLNFDFSSAEALGWTYNFSGNGELSETVGTQPDTTTPDIGTMQGAEISVEGIDITSGSITISSAVSGGTATSNSKGWKIRWAGPLSGTAQLTCILSSISEINMGIGNDVELSFSAGGHTLTFKWWKITGIGSITVDNNSGEPQAFTIDGVFNAHNGSSYGSIAVDETVLYPVNG